MSTHDRARTRRHRRDQRDEARQGTSAALREQQKADRREALLDAAVDAVRTHGVHVSMEDLAAAAGVTKPILYRHFGDRNGLVVAMAARFANRLMTELAAALAVQTDEPRDLLVGAIDTFLGFLEKDPEVYRFLVGKAMQGDSDAVVVLDGFLRRIGQEVAVVLGEALHSRGLDAGGAEPLAHGIVGFVYGAGDWWVERRSMSRARLVEYLATTLWSGFEGMGIGVMENEANEEGNHQ